jgi:phenylacetic acid degradation operon negative regulatory protein
MSEERANRAIGARNLVVEFLGAFVRRLDGWLPVAPAVAMLSSDAAEEASVRMAISRLKARGWLVPERRGQASGYTLSPIALAALDAGDEFIYRDRAPAEMADGWVLVAFSIPEPQRSKRHALKARLTAAGFGSSGPGLLLAPARMLGEAQRIVGELEVSAFVELFRAHHEGRDIIALVERGWDLAALQERYASFVVTGRALIAQWNHVGGPPPTSTGDQGGASRILDDYLRVLHEWRLVRYSDPGLPPALLGDDWAGIEARSVFVELVELLDRPAFDFVQSRIDA